MRGGTSDTRSVPRISKFYGVVIAMYFREHPPPHFHARYGEYKAGIEIASGELLWGNLPPRQLSLVRQWLELHRPELELNWARARNQQRLQEIEPLP
jgi:hypothetical protein